MFSCMHRTHPKLNNENKVVFKYDTKHNKINYFAFLGCHIALYTLRVGQCMLMKDLAIFHPCFTSLVHFALLFNAYLRLFLKPVLNIFFLTQISFQF